jgi:peptidyl-prolyl cis-trans isomerase B (cyclophilin B)
MAITIAAALFLAFSGEAKVTLEAPAFFVPGQPYKVRLAVAAPSDGAKLEGWQITPAAFMVDGKALAEHGGQSALELKPGERKTIEVDLTSSLEAVADFELAWGTLPAKKVQRLEPAPEDVKFMDEAAVPVVKLSEYLVLLNTDRGEVLVEFWPEVAPNHVRNFLDLAHTRFYNGTTFHRVIPGFMIQGGDPGGTGMGGGPRTLEAEFNQKKHVRGVLSMARSSAPNSASSQFFIVHQDAPNLDHQYSAFGKVVSGMDAVDRIVSVPRDQMDRPKTPQVIQLATVVLRRSGALVAWASVDWSTPAQDSRTFEGGPTPTSSARLALPSAAGAEAFDPLSHPRLLLQSEKPVSVLLAWARDVLEHAASSAGQDPTSDTPNKLRARLAAAERAGDPAAFAACLQLSSDGEILWAADLLLVQARIKVTDALVQETRSRFGDGSDYAKVAMAMRSALLLLAETTHAASTPAPGLYLPNGALMFRIRPTPSGWFVVTGGYDEVHEQPRKNTPALLRDVAFTTLFLEAVREQAEMPDMKLLYQRLVDASNTIMVRAQGELDAEFLGGAYACPDCGLRSDKPGLCESCQMFR